MLCYDFIDNYIFNTIKKSNGILEDIEKYAAINRVPISKPDVANLLRVLVNMSKPTRVLEIGTAVGYSTTVIASCMGEKGSIDTIEKNENMIKIAKKNIKKINLTTKINIICGDALDVIRCLEKEYDLIFLDAAKGQYCELFSYCFNLLKTGGLLISDNVLYKGMVASDELLLKRKKTIVANLRKYIKIITEHEKLETSILPIGDGVSLSYKK